MDNKSKNENHQVERDAATHVSTADKSIDKSVIIKGFNQHFEEFIEDIQSVFPDDDEVKTMKNLLYIIKKTNPRLILETWNSYITIPYKEPIEKSDISFFINKDYTELNIVITDNISKSYITVKWQFKDDVYKRISKTDFIIRIFGMVRE